MTRSLIIDYAVLIGLAIFAFALMKFHQSTLLVSAVFFYVLPSVYLLIRKKKDISNIAYGSFLFGVLLAIPVEFFAEINGAWIFANDQSVLFSYTLFGVIPFSVIIWNFLLVLFILFCYDHFFGGIKMKSDIKKIFSFMILGIIINVIFFIIYFNFSSFLLLSHSFLLLTVLLVICVILLSFQSGKIFNMLGLVPLFFVFFLLYEIMGSINSSWFFASSYIGSLSIGSISIPIEELISWQLGAGLVTMLSYKFIVIKQEERK